nr:MAG TPA: tail protein [Caudoviricetes sp.]
MIKHNAKIYLCRPDRTVICALNGVQIKSVEYEQQLKDFNRLTFNVDRYIDVDGEYVESAGYEKLKDHMTIYLEGLDYFQLQEPSLQNDNGRYEYKACEAYSDEKTFEDKDMKGLSFNKGTKDSMEMLATNNVDDMGYAKEYITFCNDRNHELSLMHLVLDRVPGWSVGYIDPTIKNEKYSFEADNTNAYAFLNTTVANVVKCVFYFDTINRTVSAYAKENIGKDTNIFIGWRNALNMLKVTPQADTMYNALTIQGDEELDITRVNYGRRHIYNLDYYLTTNYFPQETIDKVKIWQKWQIDNHAKYIENGKKSAEYQAKIDEIYYRVPNDGIQIAQYKTMDQETLEKTLKMYEQMMTTIQVSVDTRDDHEKDSNGNYTKWDKPDDIQNRVYKPWTTPSGEVDHEKYLALLKESNKGYYTYQELRDYIIPNIKVAIQNLHLADDKKIDYNDEFESNWDLYGIKELEGKRDEYKKQILDILAAYQKEWNQLTDEEISKAGVKDEKTYNVFHKNFIKYKNWLGDENTEGSLLYKLKELNAQVDELETQKKPYDDVMTDMNTHSELNDPQFGLTDKEYAAVMNIVRMGDYTNNNIFTTSLDDAITSYEHCEELYQDGLKRISETSQPQYQIETSLDNILSLNEYADVNSDNKQGWHNQFTVGNFIRVGVRDDYAVKLRLLTIAYNPCTKSSEISVTYTNMITSLTGRDDFSYLFDDTAASQKNSISVGTGDSKDSVEYMTNMLQRMTNSSLFGNAVSNSVQNVLSDQGTINKLFGDYLSYKVINVGNITGDKAEFNELFSKYINSEYIAANSADIKKLNTDVANINSAIIGTSSTETGIVFNLSSANAKFDSAWIINGIAGKMTIGDLAAGDITISDTMRILSENGNFIMNGSAMQFLDTKGNVGIQIGYDTNKNPSIIIKDNKGVTVMTSQGITKDAIADGLIVNNMLGDQSISKDKLNFPIVEANEQGGVDITQIYDGKGGLWGVEYTKTMTSVNNSLDQLTQDIANLNTAIDSVSLTGQQVFTETDTGISPTSITLTATVNNGAGISKWYVDGIENTSYISSDKSQITIPSSYMTNRKTVVVKVECTDTSKYDVMTLYKVTDGASAYTVVANSSNGTTFEYNNTVYTETICTCKVLKGSKEVTAKSYVWYKQSNGSTEWKQIGTGARLTVSLKDKQNQKIKCSVEI